MSSFKTLLATIALISMVACNTVQGVKRDAHVVKDKAVEVKDVVVDKAIEIKDKAVEGGKSAGKAVGSGLESAGEAVKSTTN